MGKCAGSSFTCFRLSTSEESALDGAEQAAPPGVVHVDAAATLAKRRGCREHLARHTRHADSVVIVLLVPSRTSNCLFYSVSFVFSHASRGVFLGELVVLSAMHLSVISRDVLHVLALSRVHVSSPVETMRWQADASCSISAAPRRRLVRRVPSSGCASSPTIRARGSVGVSHVSQLSRHVSFSQSLARAWHHHTSSSSLQSNVESGFGAFWALFQPVTPKDLAVTQHFKDRCAGP